MVVLHAAFPVKPAERERALDLVETLVEQSNREDGVLEYRAATDVQDGTTVRFFERYEDESALEAHTETDHFQEFERALPDLLAGEPTVYRFDVEAVTEMDL